VIKRYPKWIASAIQLALVAIYFPVYNWSVVGGFLYASFFALAEPFLLKRILIDHMSDRRFIFLAVTVITDLIAMIFAFANAYEIFGVVLHDGEAIHGLWQYLYFSVVTFTTLGYGDYVPAGISQGISAFQALLGFGYFAFVIGVSGSTFYARINKL
jgi:voltage-gated potassium channel Kch